MVNKQTYQQDRMQTPEINYTYIVLTEQPRYFSGERKFFPKKMALGQVVLSLKNVLITLFHSIIKFNLM